MTTLEQFLKETYKKTAYGNVIYAEIRPRIICADGFKISVQGSNMHWSYPCRNGWDFESLELGFPSEQDDLIMKYAETPKSPKKTIYPYVPFEVVKSLLEKHGGIASWEKKEE